MLATPLASVFSFCMDQLLLKQIWVTGQTQSWLPTWAGKNDKRDGYLFYHFCPVCWNPKAFRHSWRDVCVLFQFPGKLFRPRQCWIVSNTDSFFIIFPIQQRGKTQGRGYGLVLASWPCPAWLLPAAHPSPRVRKCQQRFRCCWRCPSPQLPSPSDTELCVFRNSLTMHWEHVSAFLEVMFFL